MGTPSNRLNVARSALVIHVAERHDVLRGAAHDVALALAPGADRRDVELLVGRFVAHRAERWHAAESAGRNDASQQGAKEEVPSAEPSCQFTTSRVSIVCQFRRGGDQNPAPASGLAGPVCYHRSMASTKVTVRNNGPLRLEGDFSIEDAAGQEFGLAGRTVISLCRCGHSANKPFCDGTHGRLGFDSVVEAKELPPPKPKL